MFPSCVMPIHVPCALREKMYRAYMSTGNKGDEYDNKEIIRKLVNDRLALAQLMGYPNYAAFELSHKMAKNADNVYKLLNQLLDAYKPVAINEYNAVQGFAMGMEQQCRSGIRDGHGTAEYASHALGLELLFRETERLAL